MDDFHGKVTVITGAASGIGKAIAKQCAREGMKVVISDIEETALYQLEKDLQSSGASCLAVVGDVSQSADVESLAEKTLEAFGAVHLLFNNAGVIVTGRLWENTLQDWQWVLGVNLWGVIHGIRIFVPLMLKRNEEGHIINTASMGGLYSDSGLGIYKVTKHGIVTLSETLYHELKMIKAKLHVSVLCPGFVNTGLGNSERHRNKEFQNSAEIKPDVRGEMDFLQVGAQKGLSAEEVAGMTFLAIRSKTFYILPHPELKVAVQARMEDITLGRNPTNPWKNYKRN